MRPEHKSYFPENRRSPAARLFTPTRRARHTLNLPRSARASSRPATMPTSSSSTGTSTDSAAPPAICSARSVLETFVAGHQALRPDAHAIEEERGVPPCGKSAPHLRLSNRRLFVPLHLKPVRPSPRSVRSPCPLRAARPDGIARNWLYWSWCISTIRLRGWTSRGQ